ncbi:hypothetical protein [Dokdonella sp.]|uniref:hypothetical protein n=1 Tax=Dokdonella sp. TaxID=2291710 RepID=UPI003527D3D3
MKKSFWSINAFKRDASPDALRDFGSNKSAYGNTPARYAKCGLLSYWQGQEPLRPLPTHSAATIAGRTKPVHEPLCLT